MRLPIFTLKVSTLITKVIFLCALSLTLFSVEFTTRTQMLMGTFVDITLPKQNTFQISQSFKLIKKIEKSLSSYDKESLLYQLNQTKHIASNPFLTETLQQSLAYYKQTNGYFDITIGSISKKLYHFGERIPKSPTSQALKSAVLNIESIKIDKNNITLDHNITLDLGGMGKGFGVDKVASYLKEQNITQGKIALSGDIRCLNKCEIYIQSPFNESSFAKIITKVDNMAISTSGIYRRYATKKSEHHLINPKIKKPQTNFVSLSLFGLQNNSTLDAFATAISVMPKKEALKFLKKHQDISYIVIFLDKSIDYYIYNNSLSIKFLK